VSTALTPGTYPQRKEFTKNSDGPPSAVETTGTPKNNASKCARPRLSENEVDRKISILLKKFSGLFP